MRITTPLFAGLAVLATVNAAPVHNLERAPPALTDAVDTAKEVVGTVDKPPVKVPNPTGRDAPAVVQDGVKNLLGELGKLLDRVLKALGGVPVEVPKPPVRRGPVPAPASLQDVLTQLGKVVDQVLEGLSGSAVEVPEPPVRRGPVPAPASLQDVLTQLGKVLDQVLEGLSGSAVEVPEPPVRRGPVPVPASLQDVLTQLGKVLDQVLEGLSGSPVEVPKPPVRRSPLNTRQSIPDLGELADDLGSIIPPLPVDPPRRRDTSDAGLGNLAKAVQEAVVSVSGLTSHAGQVDGAPLPNADKVLLSSAS